MFFVYLCHFYNHACLYNCFYLILLWGVCVNFERTPTHCLLTEGFFSSFSFFLERTLHVCMFQSKRQKSSFICRGLLARIFILEAILHLKWSHIPLPWVVASLHWNFGTGHETYIFFFQYLWWFHAKFRCFGILDCLSLLLISTVYSSAFSLVINCWTGLALLFLLLTVELTCSTFFVINCWIDLALPFFYIKCWTDLGCCLSFADNAGVIVNPKGEMKGMNCPL